MKARNRGVIFSILVAFSFCCATPCMAQAFGSQQNQSREVTGANNGLLQPIGRNTGQFDSPAIQQRQFESPSVQQRGVLQGTTAPLQSPSMHQRSPLSPGAQSQQPTQPHTIEPKAPETFQLKGRFHLVNGTRTGFLILRAEIPEGSYIYSLTNAEGPPASEITVAPGTTFRTGERFASDRHPVVIEHDEVLQCRLEKHYNLVQFYVPIELAEGVDPYSVRPEITFNGMVCSTDGFCMPLNDQKVAADFAGFFEQQAQNQADETGRRR